MMLGFPQKILGWMKPCLLTLCLSMLHTSSKRIYQYRKITEVWCLSDHFLMQRTVFLFKEHNGYNRVLLLAIMKPL